MKFTFDKDSMMKEIAIAQEIIATKNVTSILSNVLFIAEEDTLTIKATDIKVNFETRIPVEVQENGTTTVFTLKSMASDKFPEFASTENVPYFEVPAAELKEMINQTIFAVSDDEKRLFMNGIFFEKKGDDLVMVGTDGRRLSIIQKPLCQGVANFENAIVPPKIFNIILKRAPSEGNISVAVVDKMIFFKFGTFNFTSVLIDGQFPNYQRVIPENQESFFEVDKKDLVDALKRVSLFVEQKSHRVYFKIAPGILTITSQESELGVAKEEIPCMYDGQEFEMAFNYTYIEEPVKVINTDRLRFEFTPSENGMKAITLKSEPVADFFHIVMPMQME